MNLTKNQKKYIRKNRKILSINKISQQLSISEDQIKHYIQNKYPNEQKDNILISNNNSEISKLKLITWLKYNYLRIILLILLTSTVYLNSLNGQFISDDIQYLVENNLINSFKFVLSTPLTMVKAFINWVTYLFVGLNPLGFHIVNIFFHIGNVLLLFFLISILLNPTAGFITSLLWSIHPILTESISWIGGGGFVIYTFFFLLSLIFYVKKYNKFYYIFSIFFFLLTLATSEKAVPLSFIFIIYELSFGNIKKNISKLIPYITLTVFWLILIFGILQYAQNRISTLENNFYQNSGYDNPLLKIPIAIYNYLKLIIWPSGLTFYHSELYYSKLQIIIIFSLVLMFFINFIFAFFYNKYIFFFSSLFIISLLPTFSPLKISWWVAERYVYLGSIGLISMISYPLYICYKNKKLKNIVIIILFVLTLFLSTRTIIRNNDWKDQDSLFIATAKTAPHDPKSHNNLGDTYSRQGNYQKSIEEFKKAIELSPEYADAYHNLANTYLKTNNPDQALEMYKKAIQFNPHLWITYIFIAQIYLQQNNYLEAINIIQQGINSNPNNANLTYILGSIYENIGEKENANQMYLKTQEIDPNFSPQNLINTKFFK